MKVEPEPNVLKWVNAQKATNLAITTIAIAEIQRGIKKLPEGKKRKALQENFLEFIKKAFVGRILPFDEQAAFLYGEIASEREKAGFNTDAIDLMIAAIVKNHDATISTRNVKDFKDCGINVINPWG
jgi:hypothetical protein